MILATWIQDRMESDIDRTAFEASFLRLVFDDRCSGRHRTVEEYVSLFPRRQTWVRAALEGVAGGSATEPEGPSVEVDETIGLRELGPYRIERLLGRGGQGEVYLAIDQRLQRKVAVKILNALGAAREESLARFQREAQLVAKLNHPGICQVLDAGRTNGIPFLVLNYVDGQLLSTLLARWTAGMTQGLLRVVEQVAGAVHVAHEAHVLHRDLKPSNIMVTAQNDAVVLDFGLARAIDADGALVTQSGELFGTPLYMAPELLLSSRQPADALTDIYALGVTLYQCATGQRPFEAPTREQLYRAISRAEFKRPREVCRTISADLDAVILTAMHEDRGRRYRSASDLAEDLRRLRSGESVLARPMKPPERAARFLRRNPLKAALVGLGCATLILSSVLVARWPDLVESRALKRRAEVEAALSQAYLLLLDSGRRALPAFEHARELSPDSLEAISGHVLALLSSDQAKVAWGELEELRPPIRDHPAITLLRAETHREMGQENAASKLLAAIPKPTTALMRFVFARREMNRGYSGDQSAFRRAIDFLLPAVLDQEERRPVYELVLAEAAMRAKDERLCRVMAESILERETLSAVEMAFAGMALRTIDPKRSVALLEEAASKRRGDALLWIWLGEARLEVSDSSAAKAAFERALAINPQAIDAWDGLAHALDASGDPEGADQAYAKALEADPRSVVIAHNRGSLWMGRGDDRRALDAFEASRRIDPAYPQTLNDLALVLMRMGDHEQSCAILSELVTKHPDRPDYRINLASAHFEHGDLAAALSVLDVPEGRLIDHVPARRLRGRIHRACGRLPEAAAEFREAFRKDPDSLPAACDLGPLLIEIGDFPAARGVLKKALGHPQCDPRIRSALLAEEERLEEVAGISGLASQKGFDLSASARGMNAGDAAVAAECLGLWQHAATLWNEALKASPTSKDSLGGSLRVRAAIAALIASEQPGDPDGTPNQSIRAALRRSALEHLRLEVRSLARRSEAFDPAFRRRLERLRSDPTLSRWSVPARRALLPETEQLDWGQFLQDLNDLLSEGA